MTEQPAKPGPYTMDEPPCSSGRVLLARAVSHYCALEWGLEGADIEAALADTSDHLDDIARVRSLAGHLGHIFADGGMETYARPFGGGKPQPIPRSAWELDAFDRRFATSGIALERPFDADAPETHWIFVDTQAFQALIDRAFADFTRPARGDRAVSARIRPAAQPEAAVEKAAGAPETLLRLPEVKRRTGLSRSTIYARAAAGTFPKGVPMGGNVTGWRESEIDSWIAGLGR